MLPIGLPRVGFPRRRSALAGESSSSLRCDHRQLRWLPGIHDRIGSSRFDRWSGRRSRRILPRHASYDGPVQTCFAPRASLLPCVLRGFLTDSTGLQPRLPVIGAMSTRPGQSPPSRLAPLPVLLCLVGLGGWSGRPDFAHLSPRFRLVPKDLRMKRHRATASLHLQCLPRSSVALGSKCTCKCWNSRVSAQDRRLSRGQLLHRGSRHAPLLGFPPFRV